MYHYTVIWGNIGDDHDKRLDHVTVETATFEAVMDAAFKIAYDEIGKAEGEDFWDDFRNNTPYDGFAILEGHISDAPNMSFV